MNTNTTAALEVLKRALSYAEFHESHLALLNHDRPEAVPSIFRKALCGVSFGNQEQIFLVVGSQRLYLSPTQAVGYADWLLAGNSGDYDAFQADQQRLQKEEAERRDAEWRAAGCQCSATGHAPPCSWCEASRECQRCGKIFVPGDGCGPSLCDICTSADATPHLQGPVRCFVCGHEWQAVRPASCERLECPNCHCMGGEDA